MTYRDWLPPRADHVYVSTPDTRERARGLWLNIIALALAAIVIVFLAFQALPANAHMWFSNMCCSDRDCDAAPLGTVKWTMDGWSITTTKEVIPFGDSRIQYNPPNEPQIYICQLPGAPRLRCLYLPEPQG